MTRWACRIEELIHATRYQPLWATKDYLMEQGCDWLEPFHPLKKGRMDVLRALLRRSLPCYEGSKCVWYLLERSFPGASLGWSYGPHVPIFLREWGWRVSATEGRVWRGFDNDTPRWWGASFCVDALARYLPEEEVGRTYLLTWLAARCYRRG